MQNVGMAKMTNVGLAYSENGGLLHSSIVGLERFVMKGMSKTETVGSNSMLSVGATYSVSANAAITLAVGASSIQITPAAILINAPLVSINGLSGAKLATQTVSAVLGQALKTLGSGTKGGFNLEAMSGAVTSSVLGSSGVLSSYLGSLASPDNKDMITGLVSILGGGLSQGLTNLSQGKSFGKGVEAGVGGALPNVGNAIAGIKPVGPPSGGGGGSTTPGTTPATPTTPAPSAPSASPAKPPGT
jgi:type VI secretion system secreted protein VgrG